MTARYKFINRDEKQRWLDLGWKMDAEDVFSDNAIIVVVWTDPKTEPKEPK